MNSFQVILRLIYYFIFTILLKKKKFPILDGFLIFGMCL